MIKPNILLIIADCLRSDYLTGQQGIANTPFFDTIAKEGTTFTDMISAMSITTPNFTSILSGRYPGEHRIRFLSSQPAEASDLTLVPHIKDKGYHTYALVTGPLFPETGLGHGFDVYECRGQTDYLDTEWGGRFINQLETQHFKEPWFILLHLWELHQPRHISSGFQSNGKSLYEKSLCSLDHQIAQLWENINRTATRPVIGALTGDHGEWVERGLMDLVWRKGIARLRRIMYPDKPKANWHGYHVYDYLVRVPLVVWGKTVPKTAAPITQQIRQIDLLPTLIETAGLPQPEPVTGRSVWPLLSGKKLKEEPAFLEASGDAILLQSPKWLLGVRHEGWKFIYRPQMPGKEELYNLNAEEAEQNNLAAQMPDKASQMRRLIEQQYIQKGFHIAETSLDLSATEQRLRDLGYF